MENFVFNEKNIIIRIPVTSDKKEFTGNLFYTKFMDLINQYYKMNDLNFGKMLILDFEEVKEIDPLVLPNLLNVGVALNRLHLSITNIKNVSNKASSLMSESGFKLLSEREGIFKFIDFDLVESDANENDNRDRFYFKYIKFPEYLKYSEQEFQKYPNISQVIIDYIAEEIKEEKSLIDAVMQKGTTAEQLRDKVDVMGNDMLNAIVPPGNERFLRSALIFKCVLENVKNALMHGRKSCVVLIYAHFRKDIKKEKIGIAISDIGQGIIGSMQKKDQNEMLFAENNILAFNSTSGLSREEKARYTKNYKYILESIFYRSTRRANTDKYKEYGLFDVICSILKENDKKTSRDCRVYIHSDEVRFCLTNHFYEKYLLPCMDKRAHDFNVEEIIKKLSKEVFAEMKQHSNLKTTKRFGGTHIEYEFYIDK